MGRIKEFVDCALGRNPNTQLSENLTLREMIKSQTASRHGIENLPENQNVIRNLKAVAQNIFQPIRDHYNVPIVPNSGYRNPEVNDLVGGSQNSQHMSGEAIDIEVPLRHVSNYDLAVWIRDNLEYDQLILEAYTPGDPDSGWVHCSYKRSGYNRKQDLTWDGQNYKAGLVR